MIFMIFYTFLNENSKHAEQHEIAYRLLSEGVKRLYGITSRSFEKGEHGKPFFKEYPEIKFNFSHCSGLAVCGISGGEIGVDAELIRPYNGKVMRRIFSEREQNYILFSENSERDFFRFWTLKECFGKAIGTGIFSDLKNYSFEISDDIQKNGSSAVAQTAPKMNLNLLIRIKIKSDFQKPLRIFMKDHFPFGIGKPYFFKQFKLSRRSPHRIIRAEKYIFNAVNIN